MTTAFDGLRVVEFGEGMACALSGMIFADNGAEVIKVEPPQGDPLRSNPAFPMWNRGKKSVILDLEAVHDRQAAKKLAQGADIVIETFGPGEAERLGLDYAVLTDANPALIQVSISGFGRLSQYEYLGMDEGVVSAKSGRVCNNGGLAGSHVGDRAMYIAVPINSCGAAFLAVQGAVAALIKRLETGRGENVLTSLIDGLSAATMRLAFERDGDTIVPVERRGSGSELLLRCIRNTFLTAECADGRYIQMCARQPAHFRNWMQAVGLGHLLDDPRFAGAPLGLKSIEDAETLGQMLEDAMRTRTMHEWMELFINSHDVGADPFLTPSEFLDHPQVTLNDRVITIDDPERGLVKQLGPLVLFERTPSEIGTPAPRCGEHQDLLGSFVEPREPGLGKLPAPTDDPELLARAPLEGKTILELAYFLAAPLAATTLGEMGARVIKMEPPSGDPFRSSGLEFVHIVAGKESISVDLKNETGREVFRRLVRKSNAVFHNFRPGAPERLGVDYRSAADANPDIVYLYGASYGSKGPERHRPAFHSTPNALNGGGTLQAGKGNPPVDDSYPDPVSGLGAGVAIAIGLYVQATRGIGQYMETTMLTSSGYAHSEMLTHYEGAPAAPEVDNGQHGTEALHRFYRCSDGQYLFVSARRQPDWIALCKALDVPQLIGDTRFDTMRHRADHDEALIAILHEAFLSRPADEWEKFLYRQGVPASSTSASLEQFLADEGMLDEGAHEAFGTYWKLKPRVRFQGAKSEVRAPSAKGEHSMALLLEAGYSPDEASELIASGIVISLDRPKTDAREAMSAG